MRYLIQDSLVNFTQMVLDASHSTLKLPEDFTWGTDLISSTYKLVAYFKKSPPYVLSKLQGCMLFIQFYRNSNGQPWLS